ncbi:class I SAM-dependent methyltransferase [Nocardiopsis composta]
MATSAPALRAALTGLDTGHGPVLDIGAGTGLVTAAIAEILPSAAIRSAEPSPAMRAVLTSRVFSDPGLRGRVTVLPEPAQDMPLPDSISAAVVFGVAGHIPRAERTELWRRLADRLPPGGPIVVELMGVETPRSIPRCGCAGRPSASRSTNGGSPASRPAPAPCAGAPSGGSTAAGSRSARWTTSTTGRPSGSSAWPRSPASPSSACPAAAPRPPRRSGCWSNEHRDPEERGGRHRRRRRAHPPRWACCSGRSRAASERPWPCRDWPPRWAWPR